MSNVITIQPAAVTDLLDLADVRTRLVVGVEKDALLGFLIAEATDAIEAYIDRPLARQRYEESLGSVRGQLEMHLSRAPVEPDDSSKQHLFVERDGTRIDGIVLRDPEAAAIYREVGWSNMESAGWSDGDDRLLLSDLGFDSTAPRVGMFNDYEAAAYRPSAEYVVTYWAGYLMRHQVSTWAATTSTAVGSWVRPATGASRYRFEATAVSGDGDTGASEPDWSAAVVGEALPADGDVTWTPRDARELPRRVERAAFVAVENWYLTGGLPSDWSSMVKGRDLRMRRPAKAAGMALPQASTELIDDLVLGEVAA